MAAKAIAVLKLSNKVSDVIAFAQSVLASMEAAKATFPTPSPTMTVFQADITALVTAESAALGRAKGAVDTRNAKLEVVKGDLEAQRAYVQLVADAANPSNAAAIVESAGMSLRKVTPRDKPPLSVRQGFLSGTVILMAKAAARQAAYNWQHSPDQKTWTSLPQTLQAKTTVSGLTAGTVHYFRVQALVRKGEVPWGDFVSFLVQ